MNKDTPELDRGGQGDGGHVQGAEGPSGRGQERYEEEDSPIRQGTVRAPSGTRF